MDFDDDLYWDKEGDLLVNLENEVQSDKENLENGNDGVWYRREERSPTPVHGEVKSKPRKRLIKKSDVIGIDDDGYGDGGGGMSSEYDDWGVSGTVKYGSQDGKRASLSPEGGKRKRVGGGGREGVMEVEEKRDKSGDGNKLKFRKNGGHSDAFKLRDGDGDSDIQEMWDTIAPGDPEDDQGGRLVNDDNFIDDCGLDSSRRYYNVGVDEDINEMFRMGKKKKKSKKSAGEIALLVEDVMAQLELAAEEDIELNIQQKPAINKLKKLSLLVDVLSKKQLQQEFLDHGILTILRNWLEPLQDGSLPNINIRAAILKILGDLPIDLEEYDRREQLKRSGLGKFIMFLSKSAEETPSNRKLAKELVNQWSRPIFNNNTRFEDMRNAENERASRRPSMKNSPLNRRRVDESRHDDLDLSRGGSSGQSSSRFRALRPEAMSMDFVVRPQSKVDPEKVRAHSRRMMMQNQKHLKMNKKMEELKAPKKKQLQATKLSVEGRGMVNYF